MAPRVARPSFHGVPRDPATPVVLFDGYCNLCDGTVRFLLRRDRTGALRFAPLDSVAARALLAAQPTRPDPLPDSVLLVDVDGVHTRSEAALRIARYLSPPWPWLAWVARLVPRVARDAVYEQVARRRLRWFGRRDTCRLPTPDEAARFLG